MTQREAFRVDAQYAQAMAWEISTLGGPTIVDKPGGMNNASAYVGLVPQQKIAIVILLTVAMSIRLRRRAALSSRRWRGCEFVAVQ